MSFEGAWIVTLILLLCALKAARGRAFLTVTQTNSSFSQQTPVIPHKSIIMSNSLPPVSLATERSVMDSFSAGSTDSRTHRYLHKLTRPVEWESSTSLRYSSQHTQGRLDTVQHIDSHGTRSPGTIGVTDSAWDAVGSSSLNYDADNQRTLIPGERDHNAQKSVFRHLFSPSLSAYITTTSPDSALPHRLQSTLSKVNATTVAFTFKDINQTVVSYGRNDVLQTMEICKLCDKASLNTNNPGVTSFTIKSSETVILPSFNHGQSMVETPNLIIPTPASSRLSIIPTTTGNVVTEPIYNSAISTITIVPPTNTYNMAHLLQSSRSKTIPKSVYETDYNLLGTASLSATDINSLHSRLHSNSDSATVHSGFILKSNITSNMPKTPTHMVSQRILNSEIPSANLTSEFATLSRNIYLSISSTMNIQSTAHVLITNESTKGLNGINNNDRGGFPRSYVTIHSGLDSINILMPALVFISLVAVVVKLIQHCRKHSRQARLHSRRTQTQRQTASQTGNVKVDNSNEMTDRNNDFMKEMRYMYRRHNVHPPCQCHCSCSHLTHSGSRHQLLHNVSREPLAHSLAQNLDTEEDEGLKAEPQITKL